MAKSGHEHGQVEQEINFFAVLLNSHDFASCVNQMWIPFVSLFLYVSAQIETETELIT